MKAAHLLARWTLARLLVLILAAAFLGLLVDIRVEHVDVVRETLLAWTPIIYCAAMALACGVVAIIWNARARLVLRMLFGLALVVGLLGFYLHNQGHLGRVFTASIQAWTDPQMKRLRGPPQTAPLSLAGLGVLGLLATLKRFN